ncbi:hypothetical protein WJX84_001209 [Apatococcus fuscideae]|uniref:Uncharacterized protein n=1 Tax=Apatococcus fuscideae TaxID=2026836 RepID=A0AAW1TGN1_9CHLO
MFKFRIDGHQVATVHGALSRPRLKGPRSVPLLLGSAEGPQKMAAFRSSSTAALVGLVLLLASQGTLSQSTSCPANMGAGNTGCGNTGSGNVGDYNAGSGNMGYCNQGSGLIGTGLPIQLKGPNHSSICRISSNNCHITGLRTAACSLLGQDDGPKNEPITAQESVMTCSYL